MNAVLLSIRRAFHRLLTDRASSVTILISLALGIGANVAMVSLVDALLFRPPAGVVAPERVVRLGAGPSPEMIRRGVGNYPDYERYRDESSRLDHVAAYFPSQLTVVREGVPFTVRAQFVSATFFSTLGVTPRAGRFLATDEDRRGAPGAIVLSGAYWRAHFNADPGVVGRSVRIADVEHTIVGVAPEGFIGVEATPVDVFVPIGTGRAFGGATALESRDYTWVRILGRLAPGATAAEVEAEATTIFRRANAEYRAGDAEVLARQVVRAIPLPEAQRLLRNQTVAVSFWLLGTSVAVLLIAVLNVSMLQLATLSRRSAELALRSALGASRRRLVGMTLAELAVLVVVGGVGALLVAWWILDVTTLSLIDATLAPVVGVDLRMGVVAFAVAGATLVGAGLLPALAGTRLAPATLLQGHAPGAGGGHRGRHRITRGLLTLQVAFAALLVTGAGLFARSLHAAQELDPGVPYETLLATPLPFPTAGLDRNAVLVTERRIRELVAALPGVVNASLSVNQHFLGTIHIGRPMVEGRDSLPTVLAVEWAPLDLVDEHVWETVGLRVVEGRTFDAADRAGERRVVVFSQRLARAYWPQESPIGRCVQLRGGGDCFELIGVVSDRRGVAPDTAAIPAWYAPLESAAHPSNAPLWNERLLLTRVHGDPAAIAPRVDRVVQEVVPTMPLIRTQPVSDLVAPSLRPLRLGATLLGGLAGVALILALAGVYGVAVRLVTDRRREIGIRLALGAPAAALRRLVVGEVAGATLAGVGLAGIAVFLWGERLRTLLFATSPTDVRVLGAAGVLLLATALVTVLVPLRRARRIDPVEVLRQE